MKTPFFSIVTPLYNREREIRRAIDSCLAQDYPDFELVIVDDGSQDGSANSVASYDDSRIRLILHEKNMGECPARNTGTRASLGEWVVFLDSDDALKPHALSTMRRYIDAEKENVGRFGFMYEWDTGIVSPDPIPDGSLLDYTGWMRFAQSTKVSNTLLCTRRSTFDSVALPNSTVAPTEYHLDFTRRFNSRLIAEVLATQYTDAPNRLTATRVRPNRDRILRRAAHDLESAARMLQEHGEALRRNAPRAHEVIFRRFVLSSFIRGELSAGVRHAREYFRNCQPTLNGALSMAIAALWPYGYIAMRDWKARRTQ